MSQSPNAETPVAGAASEELERGVKEELITTGMESECSKLAVRIAEDLVERERLRDAVATLKLQQQQTDSHQNSERQNAPRCDPMLVAEERMLRSKIEETEKKISQVTNDLLVLSRVEDRLRARFAPETQELQDSTSPQLVGGAADAPHSSMDLLVRALRDESIQLTTEIAALEASLIADKVEEDYRKAEHEELLRSLNAQLAGRRGVSMADWEISQSVPMPDSEYPN